MAPFFYEQAPQWFMTIYARSSMMQLLSCEVWLGVLWEPVQYWTVSKNKQNSLPTGKLTYLKAVITGETSNGYVLIKIPLVVGLKWLNICISDSEVNITPLLTKVCDLCRMVNKEARTVARNDLDFLISLAHFSEMYFSSWLHRCTFRNKKRRSCPQDRMLHPNRNGLRKGFGNQRISKAA